MAKEENQDGITKRVGRHQIQAYCSPEQAEVFKNHPLFSGCSVGQERSNVIIEALDFYQKWKDRVAEIESGNANDSRVSELEDQLRNKEQLYQSAMEANNSLKEELRKLKEDSDLSQEEIQNQQEQLKQELEECKSRLQSIASSEPDWTDVCKLMDPAYKNVIEEITNRLAVKFNLPSLDPLIVLVTFFMKYYYNQQVELPGMPFVIRQKEIFDIVSKVYPTITPKALREALKI